MSTLCVKSKPLSMIKLSKHWGSVTNRFKFILRHTTLKILTQPPTNLGVTDQKMPKIDRTVFSVEISKFGFYQVRYGCIRNRYESIFSLKCLSLVNSRAAQFRKKLQARLIPALVIGPNTVLIYSSN